MVKKEHLAHLATVDSDVYEELVDRISVLWDKARDKAFTEVNAELIEANWKTGQYIVEYEQAGKVRAAYGEQLLVRLSRDLTVRRGRGFSRSNLTYMRKLYLAFPKCETLSHKLTWSHYFELLKCDDPQEMQFYYNESIKECWKVRELKRQIASGLFQRLALSTDKEGVIASAIVIFIDMYDIRNDENETRKRHILFAAGRGPQHRAGGAVRALCGL